MGLKMCACYSKAQEEIIQEHYNEKWKLVNFLHLQFDDWFDPVKENGLVGSEQNAR